MPLLFLRLAVVLSFGSRGPVYSWLYDHVRALQGFRAPSRFAILACCALAVLAGIGFRSLRQMLGPGTAHNRLLGAALVAIAVEYGSAPMNLVEVPTAVPDLYKILAKTERAPLIGRHAAQRLHQPGDAALLAEGGHARGVEGGEIRRLLHRDQRFAAYGRKITHLSLSESRHEKREPVVQAPSLRSLSVRPSTI